MSTDSSDSEDTERFREAVDGHFLTQDLFQNGVSKKHEDMPKPPISLRNQNNKIESINPFAIKVTPEFQKYVSQHLSKMLDEVIHEHEAASKKKKKKKSINLDNTKGIKLLKKSKHFLNVSSFAVPNVKSVSHLKCDSDNDIEERAKQAAVSPEWVLSKKETGFWAPTKGEVEVVLANSVTKHKKKKKRKNKLIV